MNIPVKWGSFWMPMKTRLDRSRSRILIAIRILIRVILKKEISKIKQVRPSQIFLGNGSDEAIDLLFRAFCNPGKDNVILLPPTYGMYEVSAGINDVEIRKVPLTEDFQLQPNEILAAADDNSKILFICSPNNPSANKVKRKDILILLRNFKGLVVVDEATSTSAMNRVSPRNWSISQTCW